MLDANVRRGWTGRGLALVVAVLVAFAPVAALAAKVGEGVRIVKKDGATVVGEVIAETERGLLISVDGQNELVPFAEMAEVEEMNGLQATAEAPPAPPAPPAKALAEPPPMARVLASEPVPPRPRSRGMGMIVTGWILFGIGTMVGYTFYQLNEEYHDECGDGWDDGWDCEGDSTVLRDLAIAGGLMAGGGLVMALVGHSDRADYLEESREWERRYGKVDRTELRLTPTVHPGGAGIGLSFGF